MKEETQPTQLFCPASIHVQIPVRTKRKFNSICWREFKTYENAIIFRQLFSKWFNIQKTLGSFVFFFFTI